MAFPFPKYAKIKNKYCIHYAGSNDEYIVQLLYLRPFIEKELSGIEIWICCKDHLSYLVQDKERIIFASQIMENKRNFAYIRDLKNEQISHPIDTLLEESKLLLPSMKPSIRINANIKLCTIYPKGNLPTKTLTNIQVAEITKIVQKQGYEVLMESNIKECGWVIGVENAALFRAGIMGIKTSLVLTGVGEGLYKKMFPQEDVIKL